MSHHITNTESQANAQEVADFAEFKKAHGSNPAEYWSVTSSWSKPRQRLDGKWIRQVCPSSTATGRTIETDPKDGTWFTLED